MLWSRYWKKNGRASPSDVEQKLFDVFLDEGIFHDGLLMRAGHDRLEAADVVRLVRVNEIGQGDNFRIVLVGLGLLGVEHVDDLGALLQDTKGVGHRLVVMAAEFEWRLRRSKR